jgi:hypothetical protein
MKQTVLNMLLKMMNVLLSRIIDIQNHSINFLTLIKMGILQKTSGFNQYILSPVHFAFMEKSI